MKARLRDDHSEVHAPAVILLAFCLLILTACEQEAVPDDDEPADTVMPSEPEEADPAAWLVAPRVTGGERQAATPDSLRFSDMNDALHALFMHAARARDSEMGHEYFLPNLAADFQARQVRDWLALFQAMQARFSRGVSAWPEAEYLENDWVGRGDPQLSDMVWAVYHYHIHHRESWFTDHELDEAVRHYPLGLIAGMSRGVYDKFYADGRFYADSEQQQLSADSMMQGLAAAHAMAYAWVRWQKPGGEEDMGRLSEERLTAWLGRGPDDLLAIARDVSRELDGRWDEERRFYDFGEDEYSLDTLGNLIRGHKGLYETLALFGDERDQADAERLFQRAAVTVEALMALARPWGLPSRIRFEDEGWVAASGEVDVAAHWSLIAHLTAGFSFDREREGTAMFMNDKRPELAKALGQFVDEQIMAALDHQMPDGILVSRLSLEDGTVIDADHRLRAISRFLLGAGEGYGGGDRFAGPDDWGSDEGAAERTRMLYEVLLRHGDFVRTGFLFLPEQTD